MLIIHSKNLLSYLINKNILNVRENDFLKNLNKTSFLESKTSRNNVFLVKFGDKEWIVKQAYNPFKESSIHSISNEIKYLNRTKKYALIDEENHIIVLQKALNSKTLSYLDFEKNESYSKYCPLIVDSLLLFHTQRPSNNDLLPNLFSINHQIKFISELSSLRSFYCQKLIDKIKTNSNTFFELGKLWEISISMLHQDLKPSNLLVIDEKIELIDFEFVRPGSFYWDLGNHIFHFLRYVHYIGVPPEGVCNRTSCKQYSSMFIKEYYKRIENEISISLNSFFRNTLCFFVAKMVMNFCEQIKNERFDKNVEYWEFEKILFFWEIIENYENHNFNFIEYVDNL